MCKIVPSAERRDCKRRTRSALRVDTARDFVRRTVAPNGYDQIEMLCVACKADSVLRGFRTDCLTIDARLLQFFLQRGYAARLIESRTCRRVNDQQCTLHR